MSYLIRSANGQRSLTKINSNKTQDQQDRTPLRDDIIEALKGIVIKFELRIADIIEEPIDEKQDGDEKPKSDTVEATFAIKKDNIISDLITKLVVNDQQVPEQRAEVIGAPATANVSQENGTKKESGFAGFAGKFKPAVLDLPKPQAQVAKRHGDMGPVVSKPEPVVQAPELAVVHEHTRSVVLDPKPVAIEQVKPVEEKLSEKVTPPSTISSVRPAAVEQNDLPVGIKPLVSDPEPKMTTATKVPETLAPKPKPAPPTTELIKGNLTIGSIVKTCVIGFAGSDEEPTYYIPYDTDKFIYIQQLIQDQGPTIELQPFVNSINVGDIVFGKSKEDNSWYRSVVKKVNVEDVKVFFIDWGLEETLENTRIRRLAMPELGLSNFSAAAVKIDVINKPGSLVDRFVRDQERLNVRVESYDKATDTYLIDIVDDQ